MMYLILWSILPFLTTFTFDALNSILLSSNGVAKLCDFGVSHIFDDTIDKTVRRQGSFGLTRQDTDKALNLKPMAHAGLMTKTEGTWAFWSPEMCEGGRAFSGYAADLWAAGVCLYIFVTGKLPFYSESPGDLIEMIKEGNVPYDENLSDPLIDLLHMTLHKDPERRAGVGDCLKHPFLTTARAHRVQQLNAEFARSKATSTVVGESDIRHVSFIGPVLRMPIFYSTFTHHLFAFFKSKPGISYRHTITGCVTPISFKAATRGVQSSKESFILRWSGKIKLVLRS